MTVLPALDSARAQTAAVTLGAVLLVTAAAAGRLPTTLVLGALAVALLSLVALARPTTAVLVGTAAVACLPVYYGRYVGGTRLGITPVVVVAVVLLPAALRHCRAVRLGPLDTAVLAFVAVRALSFVLNYRGPVGTTASLALLVLLPYAVMRVLLLLPGALERATAGLVVAAVPLSVVAVRERGGEPNPFFTWITPDYQAAEWAKTTERLSGVRVEASFGHPIAFGMYLALVLLLLVALVLTLRSGAAQLCCVLVMPLALLALVMTLSRGPLLMAAVSVPLFLLSQAGRLDPRRLTGLLAIGAVVAVMGSLTSGTLGALRDASSGDDVVADSARFRLELLEIVRDPSQFSVLGQASDSEEGVTQAVFSRTGVVSVDNAYALLYLAGGILVLLAFVGIAVLVWREALARDLPTLQRAWGLAVAVALLNLLTVNLLTNYADLFWIGVAATAAGAQLRRAREPDQGEARGSARAGTPTSTEPAGKLLVTTAPAPTTQSSPSSTPPTSLAPGPR